MAAGPEASLMFAVQMTLPAPTPAPCSESLCREAITVQGVLISSVNDWDVDDIFGVLS